MSQGFNRALQGKTSMYTYSFADNLGHSTKHAYKTSSCSQGRQSLGSRSLHLADRTVMIILWMSSDLTVPFHLFLLCKLFTSSSQVRLVVRRAGVYDGTEASILDVSSLAVNDSMRFGIFLPSLLSQNDRVSCTRQLRINCRPILAKAVTYKLETILVRGYGSFMSDDFNSGCAGTDMFQGWLEMR